MDFSLKTLMDRLLGREPAVSANSVVEMVVNPIQVNAYLTMTDAERIRQLRSRLEQIVSFISDANVITAEKINEFRPEVTGHMMELISLRQATWEDLDKINAFLKQKGEA